MDEFTKNPCCYVVFSVVTGIVSWLYVIPKALPAERSTGIAVLAGFIFFDVMTAIAGASKSLSAISLPAVIGIISSVLLISLLLNVSFSGDAFDAATFFFSAVTLVSTVVAAATFHAMMFS
jgi:uncharacterized membrane protein YuzA (DUF378 family)